MSAENWVKRSDVVATLGCIEAESGEHRSRYLVNALKTRSLGASMSANLLSSDAAQLNSEIQIQAGNVEAPRVAGANRVGTFARARDVPD
jgi:hypothetical protein